MKPVLLVFCMLFSLLSTSLVLAGAVVQDYKLVAKEDNLVVGNSLSRKVFKFSHGEAWVDESGAFQLKAEVAHSKLRCALYQASVRFGVGGQGCTAVQWLEEVQSLPELRQCNGAELVHAGGDSLESLKLAYDSVSCARVQVSCQSGACR